MSLMPYASDPEGLYECIQRSSEFGIPIYVSETGFPTFNNDHMQTVLDRYLKEARSLADQKLRLPMCICGWVPAELKMHGCCVTSEQARLVDHKGLSKILCCSSSGMES